MDRALGLVLLAVYIVGIVGLAAAITWAVIRIFPTERNPKKPGKSDSPDAPSNGGSGGTIGGRLYRRAKRGTA